MTRDDRIRPPHGARITMTGSPAGLFGELFVDSEMAALFDDRAPLPVLLWQLRSKRRARACVIEVCPAGC